MPPPQPQSPRPGGSPSWGRPVSSGPRPGKGTPYPVAGSGGSPGLVLPRPGPARESPLRPSSLPPSLQPRPAEGEVKIPAAARGRTSAGGFVPWRAPRGCGDTRAPRIRHDREVAAEGRGLGPPWERGARCVWCGTTSGAGPGGLLSAALLPLGGSGAVFSRR